MAVNATHPDYDAAATEWARARDVLAGEDAVKAGGEKYLPRLDSQTDEEFAAYVERASFFNATARTSEAYQGLIFRRPPFVKLPEGGAGLGRAMEEFANDVDLLGTSLTAYAKMVVGDVIGLGRAGTLVDWEADAEQRAYAAYYRAEQIINWRVERVNGRNVPTLIVLSETAGAEGEDAFEPAVVEQIRVLRLVADDNGAPFCRVEVWQEMRDRKDGGDKREWVLVESRVPQRLGRVLPLIPFVFHGPRHSRPDVDRGPLEDIIAVNLDHYRLDADFKHGLHFTALPTASVSGFDKGASLRIGSSTAWVSETPGANAGFLEFKGQGLETFERAMDRDERLMTILGSRMLEEAKRVETSAFCPTGSGLSVSVWVSLGALVEPYLDAFIVSVWDDTNWPSGSSWQIFSSTPSDEVVGVQVLGSGYTYLSAATNLDDWTHLCLVNDGVEGEWRLYVNAELAASAAFDSAMVAGRLALGRHSNPSVLGAGGDVDELAIWSRPLAAAEVGQLYNDGLGLAYPY